MEKEQELKIIVELIQEFYKDLKPFWNSLLIFQERGKEWIENIKHKYKNDKITVQMYDVYLIELYQFIEGNERKHHALIMKGGGIKGLAYVGALEVLSEHYNFDWYAGTSAGAITALLLASGFSVEELKVILQTKNFNDFKDANVLRSIYNLATKQGLYESYTFSEWIDNLLAEKLSSSTAIKLRHLPNRVSIYASRRDLPALVFDSNEEKSKDINAAYAARCSMSIPIFFIPQKSEGLNVFDGGMQNNFPVDILLKNNPKSTFLGLYLGEEIYTRKKNNFLLDLLKIWTEASDPEVLERYKDNIIVIDTRPISTIDFKINVLQKEFLLESGRLAAIKHLHKHCKIDMSLCNYEKRKSDHEFTRKKLLNKQRSRRSIFVLCCLIVIFLKYF